jgi:urease accessory protein
MTNLLTLLQINDSMFPIGSFTQSYGLESYINERIVHDNASAEQYTRTMLEHNIFYNDAAFVYKAWHYAADTKTAWKNIKQLDELVTALKSPIEIKNASQKLGIRFLKLTKELKSNDICNTYLAAIEKGEASGHYAIAFAVYANTENIPIKETLAAFYYNTLNGIVTNCAKMVPISQSIAQKILYHLQPLVSELIEKQAEMPESHIGICCIGQEIKSMQHEKLYSRIYIS